MNQENQKEQVNIDPVGTITSPDSLLDDESSMEFFMLRDESIAICRHREELPYPKNRTSYLASGRFSPKYKKVIFWGDSVNSRRAFNVLIENRHIEVDFTFHVAGATTKITKNKSISLLSRYDNVKRASIQRLLDKGHKLQSAEDKKN